jgi:adenosylcobalamin-dependent ribonucleoside-triphosphate reductase
LRDGAEGKKKKRDLRVGRKPLEGYCMAFRLTQKFLSEFEGRQPRWGFGDLSYLVYKRTYARIMQNGLQEEYVDTCVRVTEGVFDIQRKHCKDNRLPWNAHKAQKTAQEFFRRMWDFKFTPPGRGFWIMGTPMVEKVGSAALQNCGFTSTEDVSIELGNSFSWAMDMLMLGVGVGFDTKGAGLITIKKPSRALDTFEISDDREGWVESVRLLLNSYQTGGNILEFVYSKIRKRGEPIKGFGGTASGPEPLRELHSNIRKILNLLDGQSLTSVAIVDLMNFIGKCVVAGNVRRSAELAIGDIEDVDYVTMKDWRKFPEEVSDRRWASNNSVFANPLSKFDDIAPNIALNGEPGLIFIENARHYGRFKDGWIPFEDDRYDNVKGFNPCAEQQLEDKELCCLVETYPANHETVEDYHRTLKFAYLYAKTVTLLPTHDERTNSVMMRNRRIGCSMSGIQQAIQKFGMRKFFSEFCDKGYGVIRSWDRIYSRWLGIPRSIRMSTVKPSGTVSILAGATPGIHYTHAEFYFRTVRIPVESPLVVKLLKAGYRIEIDVNNAVREDKSAILIKDSAALESYKNSGFTTVVYFPVKEKNFTKSKFDATLWEQLTFVREMQHYWSDNSVSCTVTVQEHEKDQLPTAIEAFAPYVKTLSFLPLTNHGYAQAPYSECSEEDYHEYAGSLKELSLANSNEATIKGSRFCTNDTCEI